MCWALWRLGRCNLYRELGRLVALSTQLVSLSQCIKLAFPLFEIQAAIGRHEILSELLVLIMVQIFDCVNGLLSTLWYLHHLFLVNFMGVCGVQILVVYLFLAF